MSCDDEHPAQELPSRDASVRRVAVSNTWSVLTEIVGEAWGMDQEGCQLYLDRACGEDGLLRAEAESLLAQQKTMGGFLKESAETEVLSLKVSIGQQVGPYRIEEEIGEGSTGVVFRATDLRLERIVALKILKPGDNRFTQHAARFVAEARTVAALNHPNIVTVYEAGVSEAGEYIAMEYVHGVRLDRLIAAGSIPTEDVFQYAEQIAEALAKAHASGIIHRDLKPGNVIVSRDKSAKVLDFGLAKRIGERACPAEASPFSRGVLETGGFTLDGAILGTPAYMSPEQARGEAATERSDVFSFGALLYEMATGRKAFEANTTLSSLTAVLHSQPKPFRRIAGRVPARLQSLVWACLRKDSGERPSIDEVWRTLKRLRSARRKSAPWLVSLLALGTTILLVLVVPVFENFFEARPPDEPAMAAPLTSHPGREGAPALSSDGKMVAYPWTQPDMEDSEIYVREFPAGLDRKLTADGRNSNPVWSHDGRWIAYRHGLSSYLFQLRLMRSDGSDNHVLARLGPFSLPPTTGLAWSPDGAWLVASDVQTPGESEALFRIDRRSGAKTRLTTPLANSVGDSSPAISWSGKFLAFARLEHYGLGDIWVVPIGRNGLPTAAARQVTHQNTRAATPAWMPRDREIVFHSGFDYSQLVRIRADGGGQPITLRFGDGCEHPSIDRSGDIVFTRQHIQMNINLVALNAKGFPVGKSRLIAPSTRMDQFPRFLPDGKGIVFQSNRNGSSEIWTAKPDGSDALTLTSLRANSERPRPSPDGSTIVFESNATGIVKLYTVPISGGKPTRITYGAGADKGAAWSEDGRWIYFSSDREGRAAIYRAAAGGGPVQRVADGAAANLTDPVVSAGYLYFNRRENGQNLVWRESRVTGRGKLLTNDAYYADYWPSIRGLYYSSDSSGRRTLLLQRPGAFEASVVLSSDKPMDGPVVSKDGSRLLFFQLEEWTKNLFFSKLRN